MTQRPGWSGEPGDPAAEARLLAPSRLLAQERWREFIRAAQRQQRHGDDGARHTLEQAWRHSIDRDTQAATLHQWGRLCWIEGCPERAAGFFLLARALRRGFSAPELTASSESALADVRQILDLDAVVLSGGRGRRMAPSRPGGRGGAEQRLDKAELSVSGWPMLDHVLLAACGARTTVVAGPRRRGLGDPEFVREDPPGSGPVAAIGAAARLLSAGDVAVLAADLPLIGDGLPALRAGLRSSGADVAVFVDLDGSLNYLAAVWRTEALRAALRSAGELQGAPVRALYEHVEIHTVADFDGVAQDCDTPDQLHAARQRVLSLGMPATGFSALPPLPSTPLAWPGLELAAPS